MEGDVGCSSVVLSLDDLLRCGPDIVLWEESHRVDPLLSATRSFTVIGYRASDFFREFWRNRTAFLASEGNSRLHRMEVNFLMICGSARL